MTRPLLRIVLDSPVPDLLDRALTALTGFRPLGLGRCPKRPVSWERPDDERALVRVGDDAPTPEEVIEAARRALAEEDKVELWGALRLGPPDQTEWISRLSRPTLVAGDGSQTIEHLPALSATTRGALDLRLAWSANEAALLLRLHRDPDHTVLELQLAQPVSPISRAERLSALAAALEHDDRPFHAAVKVYPAHVALTAAAERLAQGDAGLHLSAAWRSLLEAATALAADRSLERHVLESPRTLAWLDRLHRDWPGLDQRRAIATLAATPDEAWLDDLLAHAEEEHAPALATAISRRPPWPDNVNRLLPFASWPVGPVGVRARHALLRWGISALGTLNAALPDKRWTAAQVSALRKTAHEIDRGQTGSELESPPLPCLELLRCTSAWGVQVGLSWLGELGPGADSTVDAVLELLAACQDDERELLRGVAVRTLGEIGAQHPAAQQAVLAALEDPWRPARVFAIRAAVRLDLAPKQLAGAILNCVGADPGYQSQLVPAAACALRQLYGAQPSLRQACEQSLEDEENAAIRSALAESLREPEP